MRSTSFPGPAVMLASASAELLHHSEADAPSPNPLSRRTAELWLYRSRTAALLRRYLRFSIEVGRLPSILGRELFRSKVTSYRMTSFEDAVIFVYDVERALEQLNAFGQLLIATIIFQEYTQDEAAEQLRCARRTICREFPEALDRISEIFLEGGLLNRLPVSAVENKFVQSVAQFPFSECYSENREQENRARPRGAFFCWPHKHPMRKNATVLPPDLSALRRQITELVAKNAVTMVQTAIDAINEEGQYQAIKYLFEMVGLYPALAGEEAPIEDSLTKMLLRHLGLPEAVPAELMPQEKEFTASDPLK